MSYEVVVFWPGRPVDMDDAVPVVDDGDAYVKWSTSLSFYARWRLRWRGLDAIFPNNSAEDIFQQSLRWRPTGAVRGSATSFLGWLRQPDHLIMKCVSAYPFASEPLEQRACLESAMTTIILMAEFVEAKGENRMALVVI